jgi:hypothetical protein
MLSARKSVGVHRDDHYQIKALQADLESTQNDISSLQKQLGGLMD